MLELAPPSNIQSVSGHFLLLLETLSHLGLLQQQLYASVVTDITVLLFYKNPLFSLVMYSHVYYDFFFFLQQKIASC